MDWETVLKAYEGIDEPVEVILDNGMSCAGRVVKVFEDFEVPDDDDENEEYVTGIGEFLFGDDDDDDDIDIEEESVVLAVINDEGKTDGFAWMQTWDIARVYAQTERLTALRSAARHPDTKNVVTSKEQGLSTLLGFSLREQKPVCLYLDDKETVCGVVEDYSEDVVLVRCDDGIAYVGREHISICKY